MDNQEQNRMFDNVAKEVGFFGKTNWKNERAEDNFKDAFHWYMERGGSYQELVEQARDWWEDNRHKYS